WKFADALHHFKKALAGNLLGLRSPAAVAVQAADAAARAEQPTEAIELLELASNDDAFREEALKRIAHVAATAGDLPRARAALESALAAPVRERATLLASLGRLLFAFDGERDKAIETFHTAIDAAPADSVLRAQLEAEIGTLALRAVDGVPAADPSSPRVNPLENPASLGQMATAVAEAPPGADRTQTRAALARAHIANNDLALGESLLLECLAEGDLDSGDLLASLLERDPGRTSDLLRVRHIQVEHAPGNVALLTAMRNAALADHDAAQARAVEHVIRCFDAGAGPLPPPPLSAQVEHPGMLQLLARPVLDSVGEALALVWEGASSVLVRDPQNYALTGVERVAPGPQAPLGRLYEISARLLGANVPLYARRHQLQSTPPSAGQGIAEPVRLTGGVALLSTLSAMVLGDVREDSPPLRYALGHAFAATLPQSALLVGLPEAEGRVLWNAMFAAFGPPELGKLGDPAATRLVQTFWNTIPPRSQRRLQELLAKVPTDFDAALERARHAGRRVGLFLCGDVGFVLRVVAGELGLPSALLNVEHLEELCDASPVVADLVRLAVSPEYADARWRPISDAGPRATLSSGRYKIL
ncbi:MAG TPA: hypothetical protein VLM85_23820, partial [Polyangiaceae bacterium]|nr:hypothetical protein [Polyangiaceae bacterium]